MKRRSRPSSGMTLIEAMSVVGIMGVMAALAAPGLTGAIHGSAVSGSMRDLYATFVRAQGLAKGQGRAYCVDLDRTARTFTIRRDADGDGVCDVVVDVSRIQSPYVDFSDAGYPASLPEPFAGIPHSAWCTTCSGTTGSLRFDPDGGVGNVADTGGSISLLDRSGRSNRVEALVFVARTGAVRLYRHP